MEVISGILTVAFWLVLMIFGIVAEFIFNLIKNLLARLVRQEETVEEEE